MLIWRTLRDVAVVAVLTVLVALISDVVVGEFRGWVLGLSVIVAGGIGIVVGEIGRWHG